MRDDQIREECLFCRIYDNRIGIIYENELFYARFDRLPLTPGHAEVIPKRHVESLLDLTQEEWASLKEALEETISIIESTDLRELYEGFLRNPLNEKSNWFCRQMLDHVGIDRKPDAYNHGNNDGAAAGRTIHHLHWHIIPRYEGDVEEPRGGIRHLIPGMGNYSK